MSEKDEAFGHVEYSLSALDLRMIKAVPQGGNWKNIPKSVPSKRLERIRETGGRTTLYGRMSWLKPSYTITTYFHRPGNGTYIHPEADRVITSLEAARIQSFPDNYKFFGSKASRTKQIGNAVPPLMAYAIAKAIKNKAPKAKKILDLFAGAGGMSLGFKWAGFTPLIANDNFNEACETFKANHPGTSFVKGDITDPKVMKEIFALVEKLGGVDLVVGGPPCQGFSHAGKRLIDDPRNVLYKDFVKVVKKIKPKIFVMENVEGIISMRQGAAYQEIQEDFMKLGYKVEGRKLLSADYGVPQKRKRVIIIGTLKGNPGDFFPKQVVDENKYLTVKDAIGDIPSKTNSNLESPIRLKSIKSCYQDFMRSKISVNKFIAKISN